MDDARSLVEAMLRREEAAWERFLRSYGPVIAAAFRRAGGPAGREEEFVGEVCERLLNDNCRRLRAFRGGSALATWLWCLARGMAVDRLRRERREAKALAGFQPPDATSDEVFEQAERLRQAVTRLPEREQAGLRMAFWEGRPYAGIGKALGISPESVGPFLTRAKEELQKIMKSMPD